jgi:hypothetical protein
VDETELLPLLLAHRLIRRVRTIQIEVRPLGGDSFKVTLEASNPTVGEAKAEVARSQGTAGSRQELYRVAERADGLAVREDDAEPELLEDESRELEDGDIVAMAVKVSAFSVQHFFDAQPPIETGEMITDFLPFTCCVHGDKPEKKKKKKMKLVEKTYIDDNGYIHGE